MSPRQKFTWSVALDTGETVEVSNYWAPSYENVELEIGVAVAASESARTKAKIHAVGVERAR